MPLYREQLEALLHEPTLHHALVFLSGISAHLLILIHGEWHMQGPIILFTHTAAWALPTTAESMHMPAFEASSVAVPGLD